MNKQYNELIDTITNQVEALENKGTKVSSGFVCTVLNFLRKGEYDRARNKVMNDWKKIQEEPELLKILFDAFDP